jgi:hypothetical protein
VPPSTTALDFDEHAGVAHAATRHRIRSTLALDDFMAGRRRPAGLDDANLVPR